jgi:hypothetical protein
MKHYRVTNGDLPTGYKVGEIVSDQRLPRQEIKGWLAAGMIEQIDPGSVQALPPPVEAPAPPFAPSKPVSTPLPPEDGE